ncbi:hypothetical protein PTTG_28643 [Puccinia triticina 1-1 BBBD Race 1]|uniref:Uncharacterized protein n=2 Tax=Puccinia triticina TaxID=208348 RepID=A0A180GAC6_PUCT1|nr:uncharacterized protein PtA15_1A251 [Puccinia triticina]OAV89570.1 hypothetical protein PTTG_28643 [Puccinia triticina 1-1 BBBD Race 1]WAQ80913.1 hypothetical protein PtA15_1A251 [Puccinia triticina]WAR51808.1 hypothetical protein PtB15_1B244 [Puccinia triticina]
MHHPSQNGHQEVANTYLRRNKPPALSRPFPPGFTPVDVELSPCAHRSMKKSDCSPVFLPPALRSPLPPPEESLTIEKQRARPNRLVKTPPAPQPSQRNQAKFIPTIRRICNATRPSQRSPSHSVSDTSSPSTAHGRSDHSASHNERAQMPMTNRLRSLSQHSSIKSRPKLRDLKPCSSSDSSHENTSDSCRDKPILSQVKLIAKTSFPRIRSTSTSLSGSPIERATHPLLPRRPQEQTENRSKSKPESSCARPSTRKPSPSCTGRGKVDYIPPSYVCFNSDDVHQTETAREDELLKKLPDEMLDNWAGWRREILLSTCDSPRSPETSVSHGVS